MTAVLVIAPHPDDEAIGCGGAICLHRNRGETVHVVFLTSGERGLAGLAARDAQAIRETEARQACQVLAVNETTFLRLPDLGVWEALEQGTELLRGVLERDPTPIIYLPHPGEAHPDHEAGLPLVRAALALSGGIPRPELRGYEVWTPLSRYDWPEDIGEVMARKLQAIRCYRSQLTAFQYDQAIRGLNRYRGRLAAGCRYAEVFCSLDPVGATSEEKP
jgi:N-acetylglucosamine malate deacetylase 1